MNQHQRKFLLETIEKQFRAELHELKNQKPTEPSLNNYLTADILNGSFTMRSPDEIRKSITDRVRDFGKGEALISCSGRKYGIVNDEGENIVSLPAELLFNLPPDYVKVKSEYDARLAAWSEDVKRLENSISAMRIKVQIGSDASLTSLVNQADRLCSVSITDLSGLLENENSSDQN